MSCSMTPGSEGWLWGAHVQLPAKFASLTHHCLGSGRESLASRVRGHWVGLWGEIWARAVFPNPCLGTADCPGQLRDSPCPAFPLADPPRLLISSVPALKKQLTTIHQLTTTPSCPAAPLCSAASTEHIPALAPAETFGKTTHDSNKPTSSSCLPTAQGGPGSGLNAGAGRKLAFLRLGHGQQPQLRARGNQGSCSQPWGSHVLRSIPMDIHPLIKDQFADTARCR